MAWVRKGTALGALTVFLGACGSTGVPVRTVEGAVRPVANVDPGPYGRADTAFGLDVLSAWCRTDPTGNLVLSPSSLAGGLGMAYLGAKGETASAMARTLHLPDPATSSYDQMLAGLRARTNALAALSRSTAGKPNRNVTIHRADQVWADTSYPPGRTYLDRVATAYGAGLNTLKLLSDPEGARKTINGSIGKATQGQIPELLPPNSLQRTGWVLTDATYLKARWQNPFKADMTTKDSFTSARGQSVRTPFMRQTSQFGYAKIPGWTAVSLPYADSSLSALALLPDGDGRNCPALPASGLDQIASGLQPASIDLSLPKTRLSSHQDLKGLLSGLGMAVAFSPSADLRDISPKAGPIQFVEHAAALRVDEDGTEGAAATAAGIEAMAAAPPPHPVRIRFDRPYLLLVRDTRSGETVFLSRVADPTQIGKVSF